MRHWCTGVSSQVERAVQAFQRASVNSPLLPGYMSINGDPVYGSPTSMGAFCDSYYEYLLKVRQLGTILCVQTTWGQKGSLQVVSPWLRWAVRVC
jgi:hypothetical protein